MMLLDQPPLTYAPRTAPATPDDLITAHMPIVRRIAWHVHARMSSSIDVADLMQIGMVALIECARSFEERGAAFGAYASTRVRGAMIDELRRTARMRRSGMANRRQLAAVRTRLENDLHRAPSDTEMAAAFGLEASDYHKLIQAAQSAYVASLDEVYSDHDISFADTSQGSEMKIDADNLHRALTKHIAALSEREALIIQLYFVEEVNLDEIGQILDIGAARVCQIKKLALDKLRRAMVRWSDT